MAGCGPHAVVSFNLTGSSRGACEWVAAGQRDRHFAAAGSIYLVPPGMDFQSTTDVDADLLAVSLSPETISLAAASMDMSAGALIERAGDTDHYLLKLALELRQEVENGQPGDPLRWSELSDAIALGVVERHLSRPVKRMSRALPETMIRKVNAFIVDSLDRPLSLDDLAGAVGQTRFHFLRAFSKAVGMTPSRYVMHRRTQAALSMATGTRETLAAIAYATGFADQSHLSRWCKRLYGFRLSEVRPN